MTPMFSKGLYFLVSLALGCDEALTFIQGLFDSSGEAPAFLGVSRVNGRPVAFDQSL